MISRRAGIGVITLFPWIATTARADDKGFSFGDAARQVIGLGNGAAIVRRIGPAYFYVEALSATDTPKDEIERSRMSIDVAAKYGPQLTEGLTASTADLQKAQIAAFDEKMRDFIANLEKIGIGSGSISARLILEAIAAVFVILSAPPIKEKSDWAFCVSPFCKGKD